MILAQHAVACPSLLLAPLVLATQVSAQQGCCILLGAVCRPTPASLIDKQDRCARRHMCPCLESGPGLLAGMQPHL